MADQTETALTALAHEVRRFLEDIRPDWHRARGQAVPAIPSTGTCGRSALFLARVLTDDGFDAAVNQGTRGEKGEGYDTGATIEGHAWVECNTRSALI